MHSTASATASRPPARSSPLNVPGNSRAHWRISGVTARKPARDIHAVAVSRSCSHSRPRNDTSDSVHSALGTLNTNQGARCGRNGCAASRMALITPPSPAQSAAANMTRVRLLNPR